MHGLIRLDYFGDIGCIIPGDGFKLATEELLLGHSKCVCHSRQARPKSLPLIAAAPQTDSGSLIDTRSI